MVSKLPSFDTGYAAPGGPFASAPKATGVGYGGDQRDSAWFDKELEKIRYGH